MFNILQRSNKLRKFKLLCFKIIKVISNEFVDIKKDFEKNTRSKLNLSEKDSNIQSSSCTSNLPKANSEALLDKIIEKKLKSLTKLVENANLKINLYDLVDSSVSSESSTITQSQSLKKDQKKVNMIESEQSDLNKTILNGINDSIIVKKESVPIVNFNPRQFSSHLKSQAPKIPSSVQNQNIMSEKQSNLQENPGPPQPSSEKQLMFQESSNKKPSQQTSKTNLSIDSDKCENIEMTRPSNQDVTLVHNKLDSITEINGSPQYSSIKRAKTFTEQLQDILKKHKENNVVGQQQAYAHQHQQVQSLSQQQQQHLQLQLHSIDTNKNIDKISNMNEIIDANNLNKMCKYYSNLDCLETSKDFVGCQNQMHKLQEANVINKQKIEQENQKCMSNDAGFILLTLPDISAFDQQATEFKPEEYPTMLPNIFSTNSTNFGNPDDFKVFYEAIFIII